MKYRRTSISTFADAKWQICKFLRSFLPQIGLQNGIDYHVSRNFLKIRHFKYITGRITVTLREAFPIFSFYWQTPRKLVWF